MNASECVCVCVCVCSVSVCVSVCALAVVPVCLVPVEAAGREQARSREPREEGLAEPLPCFASETFGSMSRKTKPNTKHV